MGHTYTSNLYHCVFSTKQRLNTIPTELTNDLWNYIGGISRQNGMKCLRVGGTRNHVHVLISIPSSMPVSKAMQLIKGGSSKWLNEHPGRARFEWQDGYGAFTVSISMSNATVSYIEGQELHHTKQSFEDEFLQFLKKHRIDYDPAHAFD